MKPTKAEIDKAKKRRSQWQAGDEMHFRGSFGGGTDCYVVLDKEATAEMPPEDGAFIAYKKAFANGRRYHDGIPVVVTLFIPADADWQIGADEFNYVERSRYSDRDQRSINSEYKCRASKAFVVSIESARCAEWAEEGRSYKQAQTNPQQGPETIYKVGSWVYPNDYEMLNKTCSNGIHFFMKRERARTY